MKSIRGLLWAILALLIIGIAVMLPGTLDAYNTLNMERSATPTPTADTSSMLYVTIDPNNTPAPTATVLKRGMQNDTVKKMQQALKDLGYYSGVVDGQFGDGTASAVMLFQAQHGLSDDGLAGTDTLTLLYSSGAQTYRPTPTPTATPSVIRKGEHSDRVTAVQQRLLELGFYSGEIDGQFGNGTEEAVRLFQRQNGLDVDGIIGSQTLAAVMDPDAASIIVTPTPDPATLPVLVNRDNPLPKDYKPETLVLLRNVLPSSQVYVKGSEIEGTPEAAEALKRMFQAAANDGVTNWQISAGYRSYSYQEQLFNDSVNNYIAGGSSRQNAISSTRLTVADPGTSEHQLGLAFDITVADTIFKGTTQQKWLEKNCWDYGFIVRYQDGKEDITGYLAEDWHIRYVGLPHSLTIRNNNWALEEYIEANTP
ncbi:MAG TPA: peptidoglycan-binding protein [Candidatus Limiplasma sp.]|nr:peptidoglycan-binding protein [Candidatus Limiplasma sp.]HRX07551.1 peptidoglycan-binding protein [Candidatus Limiplasma sp.]